MDSETAQVFNEGDEIERYVASRGWEIVKHKFTEKIMDLQSIRNLPSTTPEEVVLDIKARNTAIELLMSIIGEIEGRANQHSNNKPSLIETEEIIINL